MAIFGNAATFLTMANSARVSAWATEQVARLASSSAQKSKRRARISRANAKESAPGRISLVAQGVAQALIRPRVREVGITLGRLPTSLDGFSIAQISDLHIGKTIGEDFVRAVVEETNSAKVDLIVITGDLVDGPVTALRQHAAPLANLKAPHGIYFVTGNHEYYSGVDSWLSYLGDLGIRVLRNERVRIGEGQEYFDLAGIDDYRAHRYAGHGPDLTRALSGRDLDKEVVLLAHQPRHVYEAKLHNVGLQLSGHTHGGQIWPWHYVAKASQGGLLAGHSHHEGTQLYISRGAGYWGPPVRVFAKSEITRLTLSAGTVAL